MTKKQKKNVKINIFLWFMIYVFVSSEECGAMDLKTALIWVLVCLAAMFLVNRKKSAVSRKYNGQARNEHYKCVHKDFTPNNR